MKFQRCNNIDIIKVEFKVDLILLLDKADTLLAQHYGFTDEELDFIINYDIKYRLGKELDNEEE